MCIRANVAIEWGAYIVAGDVVPGQLSNSLGYCGITHPALPVDVAIMFGCDRINTHNITYVRLRSELFQGFL